MELTTGLVVAFLFLELFFIATIEISFCNGSSNLGCIESERKALLRFKQDLNDSSNRLTSWNGDGDCCKWAGVVCNNFTGYVVELNLRNPFNDFRYDDYAYADKSAAYWRSKLVGKINPSLLDLKHLNHLDLSGNDFEGIQIPKFLGFMRNLRYLNLSDTGFEGIIPHQIGNLSNLQHLDLSLNPFDLYVENLHWISSLSSLKHLDLSSVNLGNASDLLMAVNSLPSLQVLKLSDCQLHHFPPSSTNLSTVHTLDLSHNMFANSSIPNWIFGLQRLVFLDLSDNNFIGPIPNGLRNLSNLKYLDLSINQFNSTLPNWFSEFNGLEYLSLKLNSLAGMISSGLGNLTSIQTLDLGYNEFEGKIPRSFKRLCNLKSISIPYSSLRQEISEVLDIFSECVAYPLVSLDLSSNQFSGNLTNNLGKFKNLQSFDLSYNSLSGPIPQSLGELSYLTILRLNDNKLEGSIPLSLGKLSSLLDMDLSSNSLSGSLPSSLGKLSSLKSLQLFHNKLEGSLPLSLGQLSSLESLYLSSNKLNGTLSEIHFINLTKLTYFDVFGNSIILKLNSDWVPPFQLKSLRLTSCLLGPQFPQWLRSQKNLSTLDISNTGVSDTIPDWFWKTFSNMNYVNLSHNQIHREIKDLIEVSQIFTLDLNSNNFSGPLPPISFTGFVLDLSNNFLWGSIFPLICHESRMSENLQYLSLAKNSLSGDIPDCWMKWPELVLLNLGHNNLSGSLPFSIGNLTSLQSLNLRNNKLSGFIPDSFKNCTELIALDIGGNEFVGRIPTWIGDTFSKMAILNLRSNKFHGLLPPELCHLTSLQILDLAYNNLSGMIPRCLNNFSAMIAVNYSMDNAIYYLDIKSADIIEDTSLVTKGVPMDYDYILNLVRSIDISKNYLSGQIPMEVTNLGALQSLNLSHNLFSGEIPQKIGAMKSLESIDLSRNQLSGRIPQSMSSLTFLNHLNLSNNNLSGKIPSSTQLQSFDASSFIGNNLCGSPLLKNCTDQNVQVLASEDEIGDEDEVDYWLYISIVIGFVVGFWCFIGPLLVNQRWKYQYCHFLDRLRDKFGCFK